MTFYYYVKTVGLITGAKQFQVTVCNAADTFTYDVSLTSKKYAINPG